MDNEPTSDMYFWCSFEARQQNSMLIQYVVLASQSVMFILMAYGFMKAKKQRQLSQVSIVYKFILSWLLCFFLKTLVNVLAYFIYISKSPLNNISNENTIRAIQQDYQPLLRMISAVFLFLDVMTTFFLQVAMIYIPYLWIKNSLQYISKRQRQYQIELTMQLRKKIATIYKFLQIAAKYLLFRNIYILYFLGVSLMVIFSDRFLQYNSYIRSIVSIIQSFVILCIYPLGLHTFFAIRQKIGLKEKQEKSMLIEYTILLGCNVLRIILNTIFYFTDLIHYQPDQYCYDDHDSKETMINCLFLFLGLGLMHILPGSMILYVYWPSKPQENSLKSSLLVSS